MLFKSRIWNSPSIFFSLSNLTYMHKSSVCRKKRKHLKDDTVIVGVFCLQVYFFNLSTMLLSELQEKQNWKILLLLWISVAAFFVATPSFVSKQHIVYRETVRLRQLLNNATISNMEQPGDHFFWTTASGTCELIELWSGILLCFEFYHWINGKIPKWSIFVTL